MSPLSKKRQTVLWLSNYDGCDLSKYPQCGCRRASEIKVSLQHCSFTAHFIYKRANAYRLARSVSLHVLPRLCDQIRRRQGWLWLPTWSAGPIEQRGWRFCFSRSYLSGFLDESRSSLELGLSGTTGETAVRQSAVTDCWGSTSAREPQRRPGSCNSSLYGVL